MAYNKHICMMNRKSEGGREGLPDQFFVLIQV